MREAISMMRYMHGHYSYYYVFYLCYRQRHVSAMFVIASHPDCIPVFHVSTSAAWTLTTTCKCTSRGQAMYLVCKNFIDCLSHSQPLPGPHVEGRVWLRLHTPNYIGITLGEPCQGNVAIFWRLHTVSIESWEVGLGSKYTKSDSLWWEWLMTG